MYDKTVDENQLMELVRDSKDMNVAADVITPFHFLAVIGYLYFLKDDKRVKPIGIIRIHPHPKTGYAFDLNEIQNWDFDDVKIVYAKGTAGTADSILRDLFKALLHRGRKDKNVLYFIAPGTPLLRSIRGLLYSEKRIVRVAVDDGTATFYGKIEWAKNVIDSSKSIAAGIRSYCFNVMYDLIKYIYGIRIDTFCLFDNKNFFESKIVKCYRRAFECRVFNTTVRPENKYVIYLSQPYEGNVEIEMKGIVFDIFKRLTNDGMEIFVKLHPRESEWGDMRFQYIEKKIAIESFIANTQVKPEFVFGWDTTALFTISGTWGINCYSMCDLISETECRAMENCKKLMKTARKHINSIFYGSDLLRRLN